MHVLNFIDGKGQGRRARASTSGSATGELLGLRCAVSGSGGSGGRARALSDGAHARPGVHLFAAELLLGDMEDRQGITMESGGP
jgi:hypothetical protein